MATKVSNSIKFLCGHCNQVLKVSSHKIGAKARCPKCKNSLQVPTEKEANEAIERFKEQRKKEAKTSEKKDAKQKATSTATADPPNDDPWSEFAVFDLDTELVYETDVSYAPKSSNVKVDREKVAVSRTVLYMQGVMLALVAAVFFTLGMIMGTDMGANVEGDVVAQDSIVTGQVKYRTEDGETIADKGAVVIILPADEKPTSLPASEGLRPGTERPPDEDLKIIEDLGGAYAQTDEHGNFEFVVVARRSYRVLYISNHVSRGQEEFPPGELLEISEYFEKPRLNLIGDKKHKWITAGITRPQWTLDDIVF